MQPNKSIGIPRKMNTFSLQKQDEETSIFCQIFPRISLLQNRSFSSIKVYVAVQLINKRELRKMLLHMNRKIEATCQFSVDSKKYLSKE